MTDDIIKNIYNKFFKNWFNKNYKFLTTILLYILYQSNFIISLVSSFGINFNKIPRTPRIFCFFINDLIYIIILILIFKEDIKRGIKDLRKNFANRAILSLNSCIIGCILMI